MQAISRADAEARPTRAHVGFSVGPAVIGFFVVSGYGAGIVWLWMKSEIPAPILLLNVAVWIFFAWYWQRNLRRVLGAGPKFALAVTDRAILLPLVHVDKVPPPHLDRVLEIPGHAVRSSRYVDLRTIIRTDHNGRREVSNRQTFVLRLGFAHPVPDDVLDLLAKLRALPGFQGTHLHVPEPTVLEGRFALGQRKAVARTLAALDPRLAPTPERETRDLTDPGVDAAAFEAGLDRLDAFGDAIAVSRARRVRAREADSGR